MWLCKCGHDWERHHTQTANGAYACTYHGCGCRDVVREELTLYQIEFYVSLGWRTRFNALNRILVERHPDLVVTVKETQGGRSYALFRGSDKLTPWASSLMAIVRRMRHEGIFSLEEN